MKLKKLIKHLLPYKMISILRNIKNHIPFFFTIKTYSQDGEDLLLRKIFNDINNGFYVDIGAHHPIRFSNTYYLYKKGWHGINIDPMPGSMKLFNKLRPKDINLEIAIGEKKGKTKYFIFDEPALNTCNENLAKIITQNTNNKVINIVDIDTYPLSDILAKYIPKNEKINFLNIDCEGIEYEILKSNCWERYRPDLICIEILSSDIEDIINSNIYKYLSKLEYAFIYKAFNSCMFIRKDIIEYKKYIKYLQD